MKLATTAKLPKKTSAKVNDPDNPAWAEVMLGAPVLKRGRGGPQATPTKTLTPGGVAGSMQTVKPSVVKKGSPMRFVAIFQDSPAMLAVRRERESLHLAYLRKHQSEILIGGGLREEAGGAFVGGLWVLEVESRERAVTLIENDPYFVPACRTYQLLVWGKALPELAAVL